MCARVCVYFTCILGYLIRISFIPQIAKGYNEKNERLTSDLKTTHTFSKSHTKHIISDRIILHKLVLISLKNMYFIFVNYMLYLPL